MKDELFQYSDNINDYLQSSKVIDYNNKEVVSLSDDLFRKAQNSTDYIKLAFEYVRDKTVHSSEIDADTLPISASEVLIAGHGICFARSHLLTALLRRKGVPAGLCYQKIILDDESLPVLAYHGLVGVYIEERNIWLRIDAGIKQQFSIDEEIVLKMRSEKGEKDVFAVYPEPDVNVLNKMMTSKTRTALWSDLPTKLRYISE